MGLKEILPVKLWIEVFKEIDIETTYLDKLIISIIILKNEGVIVFTAGNVESYLARLQKVSWRMFIPL